MDLRRFDNLTLQCASIVASRRLEALLSGLPHVVEVGTSPRTFQVLSDAAAATRRREEFACEPSRLVPGAWTVVGDLLWSLDAVDAPPEDFRAWLAVVEMLLGVANGRVYSNTGVDLTDDLRCELAVSRQGHVRIVA